MGLSIFMGLLLGTGLLTGLAWKINVRLRLGLTCGPIFGLVVGVLTAVLLPSLRGLSLLFVQAAMIALLTLAGFAFRFYRDPDRQIPDDPSLILSPADGTIRYIQPFQAGQIPLSEKKGKIIPLEELTRTDLLDADGLVIGIEMSVLDVHVNRVPVAGRILLQESHPGPFLSLRSLESIAQNERMTTVMDLGSHRIGVVQIASRLVRRIVSYVKVGQEMAAGQRLGMIRFGSQVDVVLPNLSGLETRVRPGHHVTAGETILAHWNGAGR